MSDHAKIQIETKLQEFQDPYLKQTLLSAKALRHLDVTDTQVKVTLQLGYPLAGYQAAYIASLAAHLAPVAGQREITIEFETRVASHVGQRGIKGLPQVKNILAIASGKGGVGKSTTAVNLALALSAEGARVGILDADIYGPSQPLMLGAPKMPELKDKKTLLPIVRHGIQSMSIGYLIGETAPMVWRGPMVSTALQQLLNDTLWDDLDYLIIDLPPGTGDIQLTLAQKIPVSGAIIVTTPQDLALLDARRAYEMFKKVSVPVLGIIENMSTHICTQCGHEEAIFGKGGGKLMSDQYDIELLGALPLDIQIREQTDSGTPTVALDPNAQNAKIYREIARKIAAKLSLQAKDYSSKFPNIVIKND